MFWELLAKRDYTENRMSDLYLTEENNCCEENTSDNEDFHSTILQPFQFEPEQKKKLWLWEPWEKKLLNLNIHASVASLLNIRTGNLDWCKCRH